MSSASGGLLPSDPSDHYSLVQTSSHAPICSLNILNLCDNFVKKLVSEIGKCRPLQRDKVPLWPLDHYMLVQMCYHARYVVYINIANLCDNFVKKVVSEIKKCLPLQRDKVPLWPPDHYMLVQTCSYARYVVYINIPNLCDNFVKKSLWNKKMSSASEGLRFAPGPHWGLRLQTPVM